MGQGTAGQKIGIGRCHVCTYVHVLVAGGGVMAGFGARIRVPLGAREGVSVPAGLRGGTSLGHGGLRIGQRGKFSAAGAAHPVLQADALMPAQRGLWNRREEQLQLDT